MTKPTGLILGAAVWQGGVPSPTLLRRASHGAQLFLDGKIGHIIACGGLGKYAPSEAEVIRNICVAAGVPEIGITLENQSTTTLENITFALPLIKTANIDIVIVTDQYHARRARMIAKRMGIKAKTNSPSTKGMKRKTLLKASLREWAAITLHLFHIKRRKRHNR